MGKREKLSIREFPENLLHSVAFCCIFLVIVKLDGLAEWSRRRRMANGEHLSLREFHKTSAILRHAVPFPICR